MVDRSIESQSNRKEGLISTDPMYWFTMAIVAPIAFILFLWLSSRMVTIIAIAIAASIGWLIWASLYLKLRGWKFHRSHDGANLK